MKTNRPVRLIIAGAVVLITHTTFAQTWQTVDDFVYPGDGKDAVTYAMTKDPFGNIYAAGYGAIDGSYDTVAVIRKSGDNGANWSVVDAFSNGEVAPGYEYNAITSDAAGTLYAAGDNFWSLDGPYVSIVKRSVDGGLSWTTVDATTLGEAHGVACDSAGNVYAVGVAYPYWIVRKSADGGNSWSTIDSFNPGRNGYASAVFCHPTAGIFVVGYGYVTATTTGKKTATQQYWYVRRSVNSGASWATVDAYLGGSATGVGADAIGNIHIVGGNNGHWIVRKSSNAGSSWNTVDDFQNCVTTSTKPLRTTCYSAFVHGFAADVSGNLFVVGNVNTPSGWQWEVRKNPGGAGAWQTMDTFQPFPGREVHATAIVADNIGNVFAGVVAADASSVPYPYGVYHWLVRKLAAP